MNVLVARLREQTETWDVDFDRLDAADEIERLRSAIDDMMAIATRNGEATLMLLAIRDVGKHVLKQ